MMGGKTRTGEGAKREEIIELKGIIEPFGPLKLGNPAKIVVNKVIFFG